MNIHPPINLKTGKTLDASTIQAFVSEKTQGYLTVDMIHLPVRSPKNTSRSVILFNV